MNSNVIELIKQKGVLLEKEVFDALASLRDPFIVEQLIDSFTAASGQRFITKSILLKNLDSVQNLLQGSSGNVRSILINVLVKLGIQIEVKVEDVRETIQGPEKNGQDYKIYYANTTCDKKITVQDFVGHFRARYRELQSILMQRSGVDNLISINKLSGTRQQFTLIGMVSEKRITKNKNLMVGVEDLTGKITVLFKAQSEVFRSADELQLDEVVAIRCSGNNELVVGHGIFFPEAVVAQKTKFDDDCCLAFISDIHVGSQNFLRDEFEQFIYWLNSEHELAQKIKYLFIVGDAVDGVGVFPGQERLLEIKTLKGQYDKFAEYLKRVPQRITVFMCPGQHDASRVPEPQPIVDRSYAGALYDVPNLVLVSNPCFIKLLEKGKEFKVQMYHGASIHSFINNIEELRLLKAHRSPAKAVKHMLKRRHLAPTHSSVVYVPNGTKDPLVISETPDILCTGEVHRLDIERHNGVLIITGSCWQAQTEFEEKIGNIPDPCKVPVFNVKTHELRILDFSNAGGDDSDSTKGGEKDENNSTK